MLCIVFRWFLLGYYIYRSEMPKEKAQTHIKPSKPNQTKLSQNRCQIACQIEKLGASLIWFRARSRLFANVVYYNNSRKFFYIWLCTRKKCQTHANGIKTKNKRWREKKNQQTCSMKERIFVYTFVHVQEDTKKITIHPKHCNVINCIWIFRGWFFLLL